jgi:hypothetical protein
VLVGLLNEGINRLFKGQFHPDTHILDTFSRIRRECPSLAACMSPGPPPVTMSQPIAASAAVMRLTSS